MKTKNSTRNNQTLETYRQAAYAGRDTDLIGLIDRLMAGDESVRAIVEAACDQIDADVAE